MCKMRIKDDDKKVEAKRHSGTNQPPTNKVLVTIHALSNKTVKIERKNHYFSFLQKLMCINL